MSFASTLSSKLTGRPRAEKVSLEEPKLSNLKGPRRAKNFSSLSSFDGTIENPDSLDVATYERMVETDETISSSLEFISLSVCGYLGEYHHPSKRIQKHVRKCLDEMQGSLGQAIDEILTALWAGFSVTEIILAEREGRVCLQELVTLRPHGVRFRMGTEGMQSGQVIEIVQNRYGGIAQEVVLKPERCMHFAHRSKFSNPYGLSRLRAVWKSWFMKDVLLKAWGMTLERYGSPIAIGKTSSSSTVIDSDGIERGRDEYLVSVLENLQNSSVLVIGSDEEIHLEQVGRAFGGDFEAAQNHLNRMMFRGLLLPSLVFDSGDVGSYAMAKKHFEVFVRAIGRLRSDVEALLIKQMIAKIIWINFGRQESYGRFISQSLEEEDLKLWSDIFFAMTNSGYMSPKLQADFDLVRAKMGCEQVGINEMPEPVESEQSGRDGMAGLAPDGQDNNSAGTPVPAPRAASKPQGRPSNENQP